MTPREEALRSAVMDAGALGAAIFDRSTCTLIDGFSFRGIIERPVLELLLGTIQPSGPLTRAFVGPQNRPARELFIAGAERALFIAVLDSGEVLVISTSATMSVALGWTIIRSVMAAMAA